MAKELEKKDEFAIANMDQYEGATGFEETSADTFKTPFLKIIQQLSDEMDKKSGSYLPDAQAGDFCNTASKELYQNLNVIILKITHDLVVWKPERGGFVGSFPHHREKEVVERTSGLQKWDKDGNDVIDTISFYCLNLDNPSDVFIMPLSVTSFKYGREFATKVRKLTSNGKPTKVSWAGVWSMSTFEDHNSKGRWYSVGNTPKFERFVSQDEADKYILPALELMKTAVTDYGTMDNSVPKSEDDSQDENF